MIALLASLALGADGLQVIGALTHQANLAPGQSAEGEIEVRNSGDEPVTVDVKASDYRFDADGTNHFPAAGTLPRSNAGWVRYAPAQVVLPPGASASIAWTMEVPATATPEAGTWWSVLLVEPAVDEAAASEGLAVRTVLRYAVQMITDVGDPVGSELAFSGTRLVARDGHAVLEVDLANEGDRAVTPEVWASVFGADAADLGRFDGGRLRLYPGCSGRFAIDLARLDPSTYSALVVADAGDDAALGSRLALDLTGLPGAR